MIDGVIDGAKFKVPGVELKKNLEEQLLVAQREKEKLGKIKLPGNAEELLESKLTRLAFQAAHVDAERVYLLQAWECEQLGLYKAVVGSLT